MAYGAAPTDVALRPAAYGCTSGDLYSNPPADEAARPARRLCLASLWLGAGLLDDAHDIVAPMSGGGTDAAYVHALLHRREGPRVGELGLTGYANARYWFGVLGDHGLFPDVRAAALRESGLPDGFRATIAEAWDPLAFVDLCEAAAADGADADYCRAVQQAEWDALHARIAAGVT